MSCLISAAAFDSDDDVAIVPFPAPAAADVVVAMVSRKFNVQ